MGDTIDLNLVKQVRERTGAGLMDCKKALAENGSDINKAITFGVSLNKYTFVIF